MAAAAILRRSGVASGAMAVAAGCESMGPSQNEADAAVVELCWGPLLLAMAIATVGPKRVVVNIVLLVALVAEFSKSCETSSSFVAASAVQFCRAHPRAENAPVSCTAAFASRKSEVLWQLWQRLP